MLRNTGLSSFAARSKASPHQGYQSTGLSACCSRYGLAASLSRLGIVSPHPKYSATSMRRLRAAIRAKGARRLRLNQARRSRPEKMRFPRARRGGYIIPAPNRRGCAIFCGYARDKKTGAAPCGHESRPCSDFKKTAACGQEINARPRPQPRASFPQPRTCALIASKVWSLMTCSTLHASSDATLSSTPRRTRNSVSIVWRS